MQKLMKHARRSLEVDALRIAMTIRGWTVQMLADRTGLTRGAVQNAISGTRLQPLPLAKIERAFGETFFCTASAWVKRCHVLDRFGVDPATVSVSTLMDLSQRIGVRNLAGIRDRETMLNRLFEFAAANPRLRTAPLPPQITC